ncbi:tetratricopeptide repeat protein [Mycolicibacterium mageritense]|uniref:Tetratricopeptide repeat protein n=1 Tax=Mycolicibacterium mageritense TaxID=53462 RepID=A0AAI8TYW1_MYCME|nr:hypothetical protein [Mycolicibacterium mageritense]BDY30891.1 hypothetical protein hbim_04840 [Mycolicibacterium mageritense]
MMLRRDPGAAMRGVARRVSAWYRSGPSRSRLRRRLYLFSAPLVVILLLVAAKMISVVVAGNWAASDFDRHDIDALRADIAILETVDVIDPAKTSFARGDLAVLEGRLAEAETRFQESLSRTDQADSCPVRVNLELVQETLGDLATRGNDKDAAERWYNAAIAIVQQAPAGCFEGNDDADADRKAIRAEALPRLREKLRNLHRPPAPPSQAPGPSPSAPPHPGQSGAPPSPDEPSPGQPSPGAPTPGAPTPEPGANMPSPDAPEPTATPGPEAGAGNDEVLDPISADRLPSAGNGRAPGQRLGAGDPLEQLKILLDNANAHGENRE